MTHGYAIGALVVVAVTTVAVGALGLRRVRTTSDFYVASRAVSPQWNAAAPKACAEIRVHPSASERWGRRFASPG